MRLTDSDNAQVLEAVRRLAYHMESLDEAISFHVSQIRTLQSLQGPTADRGPTKRYEREIYAHRQALYLARAQYIQADQKMREATAFIARRCDMLESEVRKLAEGG